MTKYVSPKGVAAWPKIEREDKKYGGFSVKLIVEKNAAQDFMTKINEAVEDEKGKKGLAKFAPPYAENDEGQIEFKFKSKNKPKIFDSKGKPVTKELNIGSGSVLKVAGGFGINEVQGKIYCSLYMNAVQVIDLQQYDGSAFGEEEGGFVADGDDEVASTADAEDF